MKKHLTLYPLLFMLLLSSIVEAQTVFRGTVVDAETKQPIVSARVGINNQGVGEITNDKGFFNYKKYHEVLRSDSELIVGAKGYKSIRLDAEKVRTLFNRSSKIELQPSSKEERNKSVENLTIFWDVSEDMQGRDVDAEIAYVQKYVSQYKNIKVRLVIFDYEIRNDELLEIRNGDISRFRESVKGLIYNGPSNYDILDSKGADAVILSSNGNPNYGTFDVSQDIPVYAITSEAVVAKEAYMNALATYTQGNYNVIRTNTGFAVSPQSTLEQGSYIKGRVLSLGKPLQEVSIIKKGGLTEYLTNADGTFELPAKEGDILQLQYLGMFPKDILIENENDLAIELLPRNDMLDEVVIESRYRKIIVGDKYVRGEKDTRYPGGMTSRGDFFLTSEDIDPKGLTLDEVIRLNFPNAIMGFGQNGRYFTVAGASPQWVLDGIPLTLNRQGAPFYLEDHEIESIIVKESKYATFRFGPEVIGPAIIVTTKKVPLAKEKYVNSALVKDNDYKEEVASISNGVISSETKVSGKITSLGRPLQQVFIIKKGEFTEYLSNADGSFEIPANDGDILQFRYLGMFPKDVLVSDQKEILVELLPENDVLDEVVLEKKIEKIIVGDKEIMGRKISPYISGGVTGGLDRYITSTDITPNARTLEYVIRDHFKRVDISYTPEGVKLLIKGKTPRFYIDGKRVYNTDEALAVVDKDIESIIIKESSTTRYGANIEGFAVVITTKSSPLSKAKRENSALIKGNNYTEEVALISGGVVKSTTQIRGRVISLGKPIQGATIVKKGSFEEYTSEADGRFKVYASEGDILTITYLGMYPKSVVIANENEEVEVDLFPKSDMLDEVQISGKGEKSLNSRVDIETGKYKDPFLGSLDVQTITREDTNMEQWANMAFGLTGKFSNVTVDTRPGYEGLKIRGSDAEFYINGIPVDAVQFFAVNPANVSTISVKKNIGGLIGRAILVDTIDFVIGNEGIPSPLVEGNDYEEEVQSISSPVLNNSSKISVNGTVISTKGALADATITRKGSFDEVYTDAQGGFKILASIGDVLVISKVGMFAKEVLIASQDVGTVELTPKNDDLEEVVVSGDKRVDNTIESNDGKRIEKDKLGYAAQELTENDFAAGATNLQQLITGKVSGVSVEGGLYSGSQVVYKIRGGNQSIENEIPPIWIVNGTPYQDPPNFLDVQQIASITVLKSTSATSRYGTLAAGGAFLIKTKEVSFKNKAKKAQKSALVSGNEYTESSTRNIDTSSLPSYIVRLREIANIQEQYELYKRMSRTQESPLEFYVDVAQYFDSIDTKLANQVRADLAYISRNNTKALRTLCYIYEAAGDYEKAALIYERILKIAPSEAQSYRDLALIYQEVGKYNEALELYYNMLGEQIKGVNFKGLEKSIKNELSHLLALHKDQVDYERFPNEWLRTDFDIDIRMVIDWSDRSVPFEFQFVNPDKKFFKWTHTLQETRERLEEEQAQGYQSEEFIIDDAPSGEWLINIQYLGDEGDYVLPPFLKYTVYRNYGTPQETKEIKVVKLFKQSDKVTLGKVALQ